MSRSARPARLLALVDSDSDELSELSAKVGTNISAENREMAPTKKARGRPPANKVAKPTKKPARRTGGKLPAATISAVKDAVEESIKVDAKSTKRGRKPKQSDDEDDLNEDDEENPVSPATKNTVQARDGLKSAAATREHEEEEAPDSASRPTRPLPAKRGRRPGKKSTGNDSEVPETQLPATMDLDNQDDQIENLPAPKQPERQVSQTLSRLDSDAGEVQLRRRLGEMTRKYESLELKYRDLRDVGITAAERNFDNLRKETEGRARAATELIASLKADLATQRILAKEGQQNKKKLDEAETKVTELTVSLSEAKQEIKSLSTKLAASRSAEAAATAKMPKVPGSAVKGGTAASRAISTATSDAMQTAQFKEDLYGDLTGLIVRVVKRDPSGQVFDCIQTGRNGTLHFKLEVETESSGDSYEEAHFTYKPQLDENRDHDLIDLLPDFLTEEIEFSRPHAAKFYSRVTKSLME
ncbi:chromosome segregation protein [Colletotrichum plurivorum]|uniref:Chromosome segregation protein n=1 Tax=Colletotrichum plurivorum TaxID=2175906 RepID=A0A8H6NT51_9PEZI|nr:chromosome segregation protein [Colletotrichum plurivorum]